MGIMEKDFWKWHSLKSEIEGHVFVSPFYEREIWWCSIGANVGAEEDGKNVLGYPHNFQREIWGILLFIFSSWQINDCIAFAAACF
jgi:hypothetical protein